MFGAYVVLVWAFVPDIDLTKLAAAIVIVMFVAGLPISWAGWGLREFSAVYAFNAIGVPNEAAVIVAEVVGMVTLLIALAAGGATAIDAWLYPRARLRAAPAQDSAQSAATPSESFVLWVIVILVACLIFFQLRVPSGTTDITVNAADPLALTALFFAVVYARTGRFRQLFPEYLLWSIGGLAAVLALGVLVAFLGPGISQWALLNRVVGFLVLLGYAAVPALATLISGERGRIIAADTFVISALVICAIQVAAYFIHFHVTPLPIGFFGYQFDRGYELQGYAQNPNAFAFQLLMALAVLFSFLASRERPSLLPWCVIAAGFVMMTLIIVRSRAGIACALAAIMLTVTLRTLPRWRRMTPGSWAVCLVVLAALVVTGVAFWAPLKQLIRVPFDALRPDTIDSDTLRWQSIVLGFQAWLQHPVLGGGLGTFLISRDASGSPSAVIHNVPVWFMAEMGIVGLIGYLFFIASLLVCGVSAMRRRDVHAHGLLIVLAIFVLMGLVHDMFFQRTFWFVCSLMLLGSRRAGSPDRNAESVHACPARSVS